MTHVNFYIKFLYSWTAFACFQYYVIDRIIFKYNAKPFVIFADSAVQESIIDFLKQLEVTEIYSLEKFALKNTGRKMLNDSFNSVSRYIFKDCNIPENYEKVNQIKKVGQTQRLRMI